VIVVMESVSIEVEAANREILAAKDKLEAMVHLDPLTEALNRHAFYSLVEREPEADTTRHGPPDKGCVVVIDIDNLKPINDSFGHAAGDAAIRAVAKAIRSIIRPDDMLFRWGGDEFLVVLFNVNEQEVRRRIDGLNDLLDKSVLPGQTRPVSISVSYGLSSFLSKDSIERAIEAADDAMYRRKQSRKALGKLRELTRKRL
jgi:diguanylate cyclase (GGDEF)-like protein